MLGWATLTSFPCGMGVYDLHHCGQKQTWTSSAGTHSRLDHVVIRLEWRKKEVQSRVDNGIDLANPRHNHVWVATRIKVWSATTPSQASGEKQFLFERCAKSAGPGHEKLAMGLGKMGMGRHSSAQ